jgi:hypothetical protein
MINRINSIIERPTTYNNVHESIYRSYGILEYVLDMIDRGDSNETIFEIVEFIKKQPQIEPNSNKQ